MPGVDVEVLASLEDIFVDDIVECVAVKLEELVLDDFGIVDAGSAAPGAGDPPSGVGISAIELVDTCGDVDEVVLAVRIVDEGDVVGTSLEVDVMAEDDVVFGMGIMVRISVSEEELELAVL